MERRHSTVSPIRPSDLGLLSNFGLRISDFCWLARRRVRDERTCSLFEFCCLVSPQPAESGRQPPNPNTPLAARRQALKRKSDGRLIGGDLIPPVRISCAEPRTPMFRHFQVRWLRTRV